MKFAQTLGLRSRLILLLLAGFAALAVLFGWHLLQDRNERIDAATAELLVRTRMMAARQGALVERADALLNGLSALPAPTDLASAAACSQLLAERLKQEPAFSQIARTRPDGEGICSAVPFTGNRNIFDRPYFQRTLQVRSTVVSDVVIGRTLGKPIVVFARAARDTQDRVSGVLFASLGLDWLERDLAKAQLPQGTRLAVLDDQGRITLRYPDPEAWTGKRVADNPVARQVLAAHGEGTLEELGLDGKRMLAAHAPFLATESGARYHLVLAVPKQVIEAPARRDALVGLGVMLAVLLATLAWVIVGSNRLLLRPLSTLSRTATRLKAGDLGARSGLPHGDDEIGRLPRPWMKRLLPLNTGIPSASRPRRRCAKARRGCAGSSMAWGLTCSSD